MDVRNTAGGSLQISTDVLAKIARLAALEIEGVADVSAGSNQNVRGLLGRTGLQRAVTGELDGGVASVGVRMVAVLGGRVPRGCAGDGSVRAACGRVSLRRVG